METPFLVAYDIADRRRRDALRALLCRYCLAAQKSVFEAWLDPSEADVVIDTLLGTPADSSDRVMVVRLDPRQPVESLHDVRSRHCPTILYLGERP